MRKSWLVFGVIFLLLPLLLFGCGISEETYNAVKAERDALQTQVTELQSEVSAKQAEYDGLKSDYDELASRFETALAEYEELSADYNELSQQLIVPVEEPAEITEADVEQALFELVNQERIDNGLDKLEWGKYLYKSARANNNNMVESGQLEYPSRAAGKEAYRAVGYSTTDEIANAVFIVWKNTRNFEANFLIKGARYGAVAVYKSGDIYYITVIVDYYQ